MEPSFIIIAFTGVLAGALHVLSGPDHLAAIAPLTADQPIKSWKLGFFWGLGHSLSVWVMGLLIFFLRDLIPMDGLSFWGERLVGVVLIALGLWGLKKASGTLIHTHPHEHEGIRHTHAHMHLFNHTHQHQHTSFGIGILHGLAGSSHFLAILPALVLPGQLGACVYIIAFGIGTILAMVGFSCIIGMLVKRFFENFTRAYRTLQSCFSLIAIGVGVVWLILD